MYLGSLCKNVDTLPKLMCHDIEIKPKPSAKLLGVILDNKFNFNEHINIVCKIASQNTNCLARIRNHISVK